MEGQGITNYSTDKPSYAFTTATTEFDDELMKRGIVTYEQSMTRKGASASEAQRLAALAKSEREKVGYPPLDTSAKDQDSDDSFDDDDDEFLQNYRKQRLAEMKQDQVARKAASKFGQVIPIQRPEWKYHVNDASRDCWVVVTLTSTNSSLTGPMEDAISVLAKNCPSVKFIAIPSTSAIPNWPDSNLPSIFVYRDGKMQKELVQMKRVMSALELMEELASAGLEFDEMEIDDVKEYDSRLEQNTHQTLQLRRRLMLEADDEDDDDEVI